MSKMMANARPCGRVGRAVHSWALPIRADLLAFVALMPVLTIGAIGLGGCESPPAAATLREWTPADHHSTDDDKLGSQGQGTGPAARRGAAGDVAQLVDLTWRQQCTNCHGAGGRGDGQMGAMLHATDLTRADWQKSVTDADLTATIKNGKNRMPKFDLPDAVLAGLVARIRALREP
jgi:cytochrome c oxidase cbb3-type subunit 3